MAGLAVDVLAGVALDGVVADEGHPAGGDEASEEEAAQGTGQLQAGPVGGGEDALIGGAMARGQGSEGAEQVGDGASTGGQDGRAEEDDEAKRWRVGCVKTGETASSNGRASAGRIIEGRPRSVAWGACATPHATAEADPRNLHQSS